MRRPSGLRRPSGRRVLQAKFTKGSTPGASTREAKAQADKIYITGRPGQLLPATLERGASPQQRSALRRNVERITAMKSVMSTGLRSAAETPRFLALARARALPEMAMMPTSAPTL